MAKKHLLFVSYELYPINPGGCGVFLWHAINRFLKDENLEITLLLDMPKHECELFEREHKHKLPNHENLKIVCLSELIKDIPIELSTFKNLFLFKSFQFYKGIEKSYDNKIIDYIEFFDYVGIGYFTIRAKKYEKKFYETIIGIRGHCTTDLMDLNQNQVDLSQEKIEMYQMEKMTLKDADFVLLQSKSWDEIYSKRYDVDKKKIIISPPPMDNSDFPRFNINNNSNVLFYGRLFQLKGIDQFIEAGLLYLSRNKQSTTKFYITGYDSKNYKGESYREYLIKKIPQEFKERFIFTGKLNRDEFKEILNSISMAVFPNYVESFCYSIHELYEAGVPIICRSIPAFDDYFIDMKNCLKFDGTVTDLCNKLEMLSDNKEMQTKISFPYKVIDDSLFLEPYYKILDKNNQVEKIDDELKDNEVSAIILSNGKNINSIMNEKIISDKSYILVESNVDDGKVHFLGNNYIIQNANEINKEQLLEKYVLIMNGDDKIDINFLRDGLKVLKNSTAQYVSAIYKDHLNNLIYDKLDLYKKSSHKVYDEIKTILIKFDKEITMGDIFDVRLYGAGQCELLWEEGYTIPEYYNDLSKPIKINIDDSNKALLIHRNMEKSEWNPFNLMSVIDYKKAKETQITSIEDNDYMKKREIYHNLKMQWSSYKGIKGKVYTLLLNYIYNKVKKK